MAASRARDAPGPGQTPRARLSTETSTEPEGITRRVVLNVLEAFFRRPWLHLIPLILMLALGATTVANGTSVYRSSGTLRATNQSLLNDITAASTTPGLSFESPATVTSRQVNELLRTEEFLDKVVERAGITTGLAEGVLLRNEVRAAISAVADGDNLVRINAATRQPDLSKRLADATIAAYLAEVVASDTEDALSTEQFLSDRVDTANTAVLNAQQALDDFLLELPAGSLEDRDLAEQQRIQRLQGVVDRAEEQYGRALDALEAAQLTAAQAQIVVEQRLRLVDPPEVPFGAEPRLRNAAITFIVFGVLGVLMSLALVIITATLDRTIRVPNDITARYGLEVLAVVPDMRR